MKRTLDFGYTALSNYMRRAGLMSQALFERISLRELERTDGSDPWKPATIDVGSVAYSSLGTSAVHVAGTIYLAELQMPRSKQTVTGIGVLNGATVGTDNLIAALFDASGRLIAKTASTLSAGANAFQEIAFSPLPIRLPTDGTYWIGVQCNGTTATTRRIAASTFLRRTKSSTGSFGTIPDQTLPSTFTADVGPIAYVY
jgi:hypothetical protein